MTDFEKRSPKTKPAPVAKRVMRTKVHFRVSEAETMVPMLSELSWASLRPSCSSCCTVFSMAVILLKVLSFTSSRVSMRCWKTLNPEPRLMRRA